jgi:ligand-binding sensor domain-containing protein
LNNSSTNWKPVNTGLTVKKIRALVINARGQIFAGTEGGSVFRSSNDGDKWESFSYGLNHHHVRVLALHDSTQQVFAGTNGGGVFRLAESNVNSWQEINTNLIDTDIHALAVNEKGHIFAGTIGGGIFRFTDNGKGWDAINTGLIISHIWTMRINASDDIFAGTDFGGVFRSKKDEGGTWKQLVKTGLPNSSIVRALDIDANGHILVTMAASFAILTTVSTGSWPTTD